MAERACVRISVQGVVQGVGYRYFAVTSARNLGLAGWVRNRPDGGVELEVEGDRSRVAALIDELKIGPRWAQVRDVSVEWLPCRDRYDRFDVRF